MFADTISIDTDNMILRNNLANFIDENNQITVNQDNIELFLNIISDFIINNVDEKKLNKYFAKQCNASDVKELKNYANEKIYQYFNRKLKLKNLIRDYITKNKFVNIDGFIRFRLKDYYDILENIIEEITEDFIINKEYDNFIKLIKKLIKTQTPLIYNLNVIVTYDKKFSLYDDYMINITNLCINEFLEEFNYKYINKDDFLFSSILSISPEKITIHNQQNLENRDLLNTISRIYEDNLILCNGCEICYNYSD